MPNIEIKETEYYNCPYCHRIIPDYAMCNCVKIYNQALEDAEKRYREWSKTEYGKIVADDVLPLRVLRSLTK